jgi:3-hydroxybutyryl-CoA dehydrogenase
MKEKQNTAPVKQHKSKVYIIGESPIVEEYAELCASKGYDVTIAWDTPHVARPKSELGAIKTSQTIPASVSVGIELTNTNCANKKQNLERLDKSLPPSAPILSSSVTVSATEQSTWIEQKHRLVGIGALPSFSGQNLVEVAPTVFSPKETVEVVARFYASLGKNIELIQDRVGMVLPRIVCQIINESVFSLTDEIASPKDIDTAMKLGANYPRGPIEWAERIGIRQVYSVLEALHNDLQEERYRVSPLLRQMAMAGEWWKS